MTAQIVERHMHDFRIVAGKRLCVICRQPDADLADTLSDQERNYLIALESRFQWQKRGNR